MAEAEFTFLSAKDYVLDQKFSPFTRWLSLGCVEKSVHVVGPVEVKARSADVPLRKGANVGPCNIAFAF